MLAIARKILQLSSVIAVYGVTLFVLWQGLKPFFPFLDFDNEPTAATAHIYLPAKRTSPPPKDIVSGTPIKLLIPAIGFDKEIVPGIYEEEAKNWQVLPRDIHFAETSRFANNHSGNTLIYAHNNRYAFGPLKQLQTDDKAQVITDNGYRFIYRLLQTTDHVPSDISIFSYDGAPLLTLMTCSGAFNEIRTFYTFEFEAVEKL